MKDVVAEQLDNVTIARFSPARIMVKPKQGRTLVSSGEVCLMFYTLGSLVDKSKLAQKADKTPVLEFTG